MSWRERLKARLGAHEAVRSQPPRRFGRLEVLERLGSGGMGEVLLARDPQLKRQVAVKTLGIDCFDDPEALARFQREATAVARLDHPHVVRVHEVAHDGLRPYLVLEYVAGESLEATLRRGPLEPRRAARIAREVALALAHAHAHQVLHRDVKPANILLDGADRARLTDFGISRELTETREQLTASGALIGSPVTMAPEQAAGRRDRIGPATDVYGLGATLYIALTGRPPCLGPTLPLTLDAIQRVAPPPPGDLGGGDPRLDAICLRCLAKAPARRYGSARELAEALGDYPEGGRAPTRWAPWAAAALAVGLPLTLAMVLARGEPEAAPPPAEGPTATPSAPAPRRLVVPNTQTLPIPGLAGAARVGDELVAWSREARLRFYRLPGGDLLRSTPLAPHAGEPVSVLAATPNQAVIGIRPTLYLLWNKSAYLIPLASSQARDAAILRKGTVLLPRDTGLDVHKVGRLSPSAHIPIAGGVNRVAVLPGQGLAIVSSRAAPHEVQLLHLVTRRRRWRQPVPAPVTALAAEREGQLAVGLRSGQVLLGDRDSARLQASTPAGRSGPVDQLRFQGGRLFVLRQARREVEGWDPRARRMRWRHAPRGARWVGLSGGGQLIVIRRESVDLIPLDDLARLEEGRAD